ncbi:MAG: polysaccharide deacetylase family protein [Desulfovibrio sp.]|nr:polysaccharide deacetylase family protein [Desulfovibrio sp.]
MKILVTVFHLIMFTATGCLAFSANDFLREMDEPGICALTFDDGPSRFTPQLLDMMAHEDVKATFFVLGENAARFPDVIRRQVAEGHEVESHSWSHPNLGRASARKIRSEIALTEAVLKSLGVKPTFFRPPYGSYTPYVEEVAKAHGMEIALWSHDTRDWKRLPQNYANIAPCQLAEHRHGVFLFHDIHERTVNDFPRIVTQLRASGCRRFVTLSEYMEHVKMPESLPVVCRVMTPPALCASHSLSWCKPSHGTTAAPHVMREHPAHGQALPDSESIQAEWRSDNNEKAATPAIN